MFLRYRAGIGDHRMKTRTVMMLNWTTGGRGRNEGATGLR
jgi:hypothetical protein